MNILSVVPSFHILGGVANHYMGLRPYWVNNVKYCFYGKRKNIPAIICFVPDLIVYIYKLIFMKIDIVIINPSLRTYQLLRDAIYLLLAKLFRKKVITFIHGWDDDNANKLEKNSGLFKLIYGLSSFIYVLCSDFKKSLEKMNFKIPIVLTSTKVADYLVKDFDITKREGEIRQILFLARVVRLKGIYITIETFSLLKVKYPNLKLSICGSGPDLNMIKKIVETNNIKDVEFHGNISGRKLIEQFVNSDLYILPTMHGEGMATSVLEAMAFGLPIVSRPVGGVKDFFENTKMGYLTESLNPQDYFKYIDLLITNKELTKNISLYNYEFANKNFLASSVTRKYESDIEKYCFL